MPKEFNFGKNWEAYVARYLDEERIDFAKKSLLEYLKPEDLKDKTFLDIGCGSGLFSYAACLLGARVTSFDVNSYSVKCAEKLKNRDSKQFRDWKIFEGSILDEGLAEKLEKFDVVYSWGVLHHTGSMWRAIENAARFVKPGGFFFIAIYNKHESSAFWLKEKKLYVSLPKFIQRIFDYCYMAYFLIRLKRGGGDPAAMIRNYHKTSRGMSWRVDITDWLGGYPYEFASAIEVEQFVTEKFKFKLLKMVPQELGNNQFLFYSPTVNDEHER